MKRLQLANYNAKHFDWQVFGQVASARRSRCYVLSWCPFRKFHPTWIRIVRQNHRIIESDVCDPARARNVCHRPIQVAEPA
jgi:hypothetical protein